MRVIPSLCFVRGEENRQNLDPSRSASAVLISDAWAQEKCHLRSFYKIRTVKSLSNDFLAHDSILIDQIEAIEPRSS